MAGLIKKYEGIISYKNDCSLLLDMKSYFLNETGMENLEYILNKEELDISKKYINSFGMKDYIDNKVKTYSNGMKKKLTIVIALSKRKRLLLLDEVTNSLDLESIEELKKILIEEKKQRKIIITSHDMSIFDTNLVDAIYFFDNHKLIERNLDDFNFKIYKVKLLNDSKFIYEYIKKDNYVYFKINNGDELEFLKYISSFIVSEMTIIPHYNNMYLNW